MSIAAAENGWIDTLAGRSPDILDKAKRIIATNIYCTLSTCSTDGLPWASPVFFTYDSTLNLYWSSAIASRHSQNIYQNHGRVAIAIYSTDVEEGKGQGVYLSGIAQELEAENVEQIMQRLLARARKPTSQRTHLDYLGESPCRIYRFQPHEAWITGTRLPIGNQRVDTKIQLDFADLVAQMHQS